MSLPIMVILMACVYPLRMHAGAGDTRANRVYSNHMHQVAFELYHMYVYICICIAII